MYVGVVRYLVVYVHHFFLFIDIGKQFFLWQCDNRKET